MKNIYRKTYLYLLVLLGASSGLFLSVQASAGSVDACWTGVVSNDYWNDLNWDIGIIPFNDMWDDYNVYINAGTTVDYDFDYPIDIERFFLSEGKTFNLKPGSDIAVLSAGIFNGKLIADNASFVAGPAGDFLITGTKATFFVKNGGRIAIPATLYSSTGISGATLFSSDGIDSELDLSSLQTINAGYDTGCCDSPRAQQIVAQNGGSINLSNVKTITGPCQSDDRLDIIVNPSSSIDLSGLQTITSAASGIVRFDLKSDFSLPNLTTCSRCEFTNTGLGIVTFNAPQLKKFSNASVNLTPVLQFTTGGLSNIDNTRISVSNGLHWGQGNVVATSYSSTGISGATLFSSDGIDSELDLSSLQTINAGYDTGCCDSPRAQQIVAQNGGSINLSNVKTITGPCQSDDRLDIIVNPSSSIDLSGLQTITSAASGIVRFDLKSDFSLPNLTTCSRCEFTNTGLGIVTFNAPQLKKFSNASVNLTPVLQFTTGGLSNIDNTRISVSNGLHWGQGNVVATSYSSTGISGATLFSSDGIDSELDLSSLQTINAGYDTGCCDSPRAQQIVAQNGGSINLSNVKTITGPCQSDDRLDIIVNPSSSIDLSGLQTITSAASGRVKFTVNDGVLFLVNLIDLAKADFVTTTPDAAISISKDFYPNDTCTVVLADASTLTIGRHLMMTNKDETRIQMDNAYVWMDGTVVVPQKTLPDANMAVMAPPFTILDDSVQYLEVASIDEGISPQTSQNFKIGQLVIGDPNQFTVVQLSDAVDNGNRGTAGQEALYLKGIGLFNEVNGLRIHGGSVLAIGNINVYVMIDKSWVHLNSLLAQSGLDVMPFDHGYISLEPYYGRCGDILHPYPQGDINQDCFVNLSDFLILSEYWLQTQCGSNQWCAGSDVNKSGQVDINDLMSIAMNWMDSL